MSWIEDVRTDLASIDLSKRRLRRAGALVATLFVLAGIARGFSPSGRDAAAAMLGLGLAFGVVAGLRPMLLRGPARVWMGLALALSWLSTRVLLTLLFALIVTPIGLLARVVGKRFFGLRERSGQPAASYWVRRDPARAIDHEKPF